MRVEFGTFFLGNRDGFPFNDRWHLDQADAQNYTVRVVFHHKFGGRDNPAVRLGITGDPVTVGQSDGWPVSLVVGNVTNESFEFTVVKKAGIEIQSMDCVWVAFTEDEGPGA